MATENLYIVMHADRYLLHNRNTNFISLILFSFETLKLMVNGNDVASGSQPYEDSF